MLESSLVILKIMTWTVLWFTHWVNESRGFQRKEIYSEMLEADSKTSEVNIELEMSIVRISVLQDIITDLEQLVQSKTEKEKALQGQVKQLEAVINLQAVNQQKVEWELGAENIKLKGHVDSLIKDLEVKLKTVERLEEELAEKEFISITLPGICAQKETSACEQAYDQTHDSEATLHKLAAQLLQVEKKLAESQQRQQLYLKYIANQQVEITELQMEILGIELIGLEKTTVELREKGEGPIHLQKQISTVNNAVSGTRPRGYNEASCQLQADLVLSDYKKELAKCHDREKVHSRCINLQRNAAIKLLSNMKRAVQYLQNELKEGAAREIRLTEEIEKVKLCTKDNVSPSNKLIQGLDNTMQKSLADNREKLIEAQKEKEELLNRIKILESQISERNKIQTQNTPRAMNGTSVLHRKLIKTQEENEKLLARVKILEFENKKESKIITTPDAMSPAMVKSLQQLHKLYLQHREHRKALTFQKNYLLYQLMEKRTLLKDMTITTLYTVKSPRGRFRCTVFAMISINRMKSLVNRWQTDRRSSTDTVLKKFEQSINEISSKK